MSTYTAAIRRSRASIALALALSSCGPSVDDKQTNVLVQLKERVSNLEERAESQTASNELSSSSRQPTSAEDFTNIVNGLAEERDANNKQLLADRRIKDIEDRLNRLEAKQREMEIQEMTRGAR